MNKNILKSQWNQLKGEVKKQWGDLTNDDIDKISGSYDKLVGIIQEKYGITKGQAEDQISDWETGLKDVLSKGDKMNKDLEKDIERLKKDMAKFRDSLSTTIEDVGGYSRDKVHETRKNLRVAMEGFGGMANKRYHQTKDIVHDKGEKLVTVSRDVVQKKPFTTVAVSFATGLVAALLMRKSKHE